MRIGHARPGAVSGVRSLLRMTAAVIGLALLPSLPAAAQEIAMPGDPTAAAAFKVLDEHCARCHQVGRLESGRDRPSHDFGNVLKLDELALNADYILPGNPDGSKIFTSIVEGRMPQDFGTIPSSEDIRTLAAWIKDLGVKMADACGGRKFISNTEMMTMMAADLESLPTTRRQGTRYLTLTHLYNACANEKTEMNVYRQGAVKLVNSLSRSSDVVRLETIDPQQTIIRINIDDIGWEAHDWELLLVKGKYPYNTRPDTQFATMLQSATQTPLPFARADWFAFTASQPPLYHDLLRLPDTFQAFARQQQVDIDSNIRRYIAQRAGFRNSGVSQNNRLIERHPSPRTGYFWTSYDFEGNEARQDLFEFPLGPGGREGFEHDGGETIYTLPNGFQAYYLNAADGKRLDVGPVTIVRDPRRGDFTVTNGISCMGCHEFGMINKDDQVRDIVLAGKSFRKEVRVTVEALYPPKEKMRAMLEADRKIFLDAMARAGLDANLNLNGVEMITALYKRYEADLDLRLGAAELGMSLEQFDEHSREADRRFRTLIRRLQQATVPRDTFELAFRDLAVDIADEHIVKLALGHDTAQPQAGAAHREQADLTLVSDKNVYQRGDTPVFTVRSNRNCYLTLSNLDEKGKLTVLFPNRHQRDNRILANRDYEFPGSDAPFRYRMLDRGLETVIAICTADNVPVDGIRHDGFRQSLVTTVDDYRSAQGRALRDRAIGIEPVKPAAGGGQRPPTQHPPSPKPRPVAGARAAIVLQVR